MKLILVSEFFYPYNTGTQKVLNELSENLVEEGIEVEVITTKNAYREEKKILSKKEFYKGIKINRVFATGGNRDNKICRIISYITFMMSVFGSLFFRNDYDKVLFVTNPPFSAYIGTILKKVKNKEYLYLLHDVYPDIAENMGIIKKGGVISRVMTYINKAIYKNASKIIVLGKDMKKVIASKGVDEKKIEIITNWADKEKTFRLEIEKINKKKYNLEKSFNIMYTGNISKVHSIDTIIDVARALKDSRDIKFVFVGNGNKKEYIEYMKKNKKLDNIILLDYTFGEEYNNLLNCADIFISTLRKEISGLGVPSKTYTYMSIGKPIIAIMEEHTEIGTMINENQIGRQFSENEIERIVEFIIMLKENGDMYNNMEKKVSILFDGNYERKKVTHKFAKILLD